MKDYLRGWRPTYVVAGYFGLSMVAMSSPALSDGLALFWLPGYLWCVMIVSFFPGSHGWAFEGGFILPELSGLGWLIPTTFFVGIVALINWVVLRRRVA